MRWKMACAALAAAAAVTGCRCDTGGSPAAPVPASVDADRVVMDVVAPRRGTITDVKGRSLATTRIDRGGPQNRIYPLGQVASHVVGHMAGATSHDVQAHPGRHLSPGDMVGRSGIEEAFEEALGGKPGWHKRVMDDSGAPLDDSALEGLVVGPVQVPPQDGLDVHTTLDADLMTIIHKAFVAHEMGAAVVVEVDTGKVRALYSKPGYDPTAMTRGLTPEQHEALTSDPRAPLLDRAIAEALHPASTFKPITALAALSEGKLTGTTVIPCKGTVQAAATTLSCHGTHGKVDLRRGIVTSCSAFFMKVGMDVGMAGLLGWTRQLGFGERTGIPVPGEVTGHVPLDADLDPDALPALAATVAAGHGPVKVTLLQLAMAYAAIASGGTLHDPLIVERLSRADGGVVETFEPHVKRRLAIDPAARDLLLDAMKAVLEDPEGTAHAALRDDIAIAGKSGTSQVPGRGLPPELIRGEDGLVQNGFFVALAPADAPKLVAVVLVEDAPTGGATAAPIATTILGDYLMKLY